MVNIRNTEESVPHPMMAHSEYLEWAKENLKKIRNTRPILVDITYPLARSLTHDVDIYSMELRWHDQIMHDPRCVVGSFFHAMWA